MARWRKGESGNLRGRPKGTGEIGKLRAAIGQALPAIKSMELSVAAPLQGETLTERTRGVADVG
jgi:hypothetical protein